MGKKIMLIEIIVIILLQYGYSQIIHLNTNNKMINEITIINDSSMLISTNRGLYKLNLTNNPLKDSIIDLDPIVKYQMIYTTSLDENNHLWYIDGDNNTLNNLKTKESYKLEENLYVTDMLWNKSDLWITTNNKGLLLYNYSSVNKSLTVKKRYNRENKSLYTNVIHDIHIDKINNYIWIATKDGIYKFNQKIKRFQWAQNSCKPKDPTYIFCDYIDKEGNQILLAGGYGVLWSYNGVTWRKICNLEEELTKGKRIKPIKGIVIDKNREIWIVAKGTLLHSLDGEWVKYIGFIEDSPTSLCIDNKNTIWIGTERNGLYCINQNFFIQNNKSKISKMIHIFDFSSSMKKYYKNSNRKLKNKKIYNDFKQWIDTNNYKSIFGVYLFKNKTVPLKSIFDTVLTLSDLQNRIRQINPSEIGSGSEIQNSIMTVMDSVKTSSGYNKSYSYNIVVWTDGRFSKVLLKSIKRFVTNTKEFSDNFTLSFLQYKTDIEESKERIKNNRKLGEIARDTGGDIIVVNKSNFNQNDYQHFQASLGNRNKKKQTSSKRETKKFTQILSRNWSLGISGTLTQFHGDFSPEWQIPNFGGIQFEIGKSLKRHAYIYIDYMPNGNLYANKHTYETHFQSFSLKAKWFVINSLSIDWRDYKNKFFVSTGITLFNYYSTYNEKDNIISLIGNEKKRINSSLIFFSTGLHIPIHKNFDTKLEIGGYLPFDDRLDSRIKGKSNDSFLLFQIGLNYNLNTNCCKRN